MVDWLIASGVSVTLAKMFAEPLKASMALYDISTPERQAGFLTQCIYESERFTSLEENLYYTTEGAARRAFGKRIVPHLSRVLRNPKAMANFAYAGRNGNGDEASGDGWRYRGRGPFQLTGKANYMKASVGVGLGAVYLHSPELVAAPSDGCLVAAWYWQSNGCNQLVDQGRFDATTTVINGPARLHADRRVALLLKIADAYDSVTT
jgi:putative chitinase